MRALCTTATALLVIAAIASPTFAATKADLAGSQITYHKDIEPLFQENCQGCHRPEGASYGGMIAPMPFTTYEEVRPWAKSVAKQVMNREMPPWFAPAEFDGLFQNERKLDDTQIAMIVDWVKSGSPKGDPADAPAPTQFASHDGWMIGEPDLVLDLAEPFYIGDDVRDLNISLKAEAITADMLSEPRWIESIEFRPGSDIVHHIIGSSRAADAEAPGATGMMGGIAPGTEPFALPEGVGRLLMPGTQVYFQMHYNKEPGEGTGTMDHSQIAFKFKPRGAKVDKVAQWDAIGNNDFEIPPGASNWEVGAAKTLEYETTIYALLPHMHLRGKYAKYTAFYPDGTQEVLLEIPDYDWNWQTNYDYIEPKVVPAGTRVELTMRFENTKEREFFNDTATTEIYTNRPVRFGGPTFDEMMLGFMDYAEHKEIDFSTLETPSAGQ
jgi:mono/diheme cytochrome c family protein